MKLSATYIVSGILLFFLSYLFIQSIGESDETFGEELSEAVSDIKKTIPFLSGSENEIKTDLLSGNDFIAASCNSLMMIIVTELGDKTFFIAAVLAMRNGRCIVYGGAMLALAVMHLLSSLMGYALPSFLPRRYTHFASAILFVYFGFRLLKDAHSMGEGPSEELQEVENELIAKKDGEDNPVSDVEEAQPKPSSWAKETNVAVFTQALTLTFLAEWGDRSQIATIALAASKNPYGVFFGGLIGHALCTGIAVVGGRMLASKISEKTVAIVGGLLFLAFAIHSFIIGPEDIGDSIAQ